MKKRKNFSLIRFLTVCLLTVCFLTLTACNSGAGQYMGDSTGGNGYYGGEEKPGETAEAPENKIIKTIWQTLRTDDFDALDEKVKAEVTALGGYISSSSYRQDSRSDLRYATLVVRIPAGKTDAFLDAINEGHQLVSYRDEVEDVTLAYVDITSRIAVLEAEETALLAMMENTTTVEDSLAVGERLSYVQNSLASLRAQKNVYDNLVAYSTIHLTLDEATVATANMSFFGEMGLLFIDSVEGIWFAIRGFFLWLLGRSPYIVFIAGLFAGIFFLVRWLMRRHTAKQLAKIEKRKEDSSKQ